ncbi:hypothetical protein HYH02_005748 [Chlamydomonas schloesseri]|uniref:Protein kinase domain-containing protein n=1 Tax=Chlamydomonas schloesseri TaxID=2026947 RepID=A0A835WJT4_9CHLO|nr:hypothetical protein HYH02_005748 [Chlamydomonas schloesseri]|eukprot:KAG2448994.1 hypothetical protein HYH02_005748 [Chlamydomonas schloesseri]
MVLRPQVPVIDCVDRAGHYHGEVASSTPTHAARSAIPSDLVPLGTGHGQAQEAISTSCLRMSTRVAAVPLMHGTKLAGALWLEEATHSAASSAPCASEAFMTSVSSATIMPFCTGSTVANPSVCSGNPSTAPALTGPATASSRPPARPSLLSDKRALQSLGFACSMCLLGAEAGEVGWLAGALARIGDAVSVQELGSEVVGVLSAHVRRRFVLDSHACLAIVPPAALSASQSAPSSQPARHSQVGLLLLRQPGTAGAHAAEAYSATQDLHTVGERTASGQAERMLAGANSRHQGMQTTQDGAGTSGLNSSRRRLRVASGQSAGQWPVTAVAGRARDVSGVGMGVGDAGPAPGPHIRSLRLSLDVAFMSTGGGGTSPICMPRPGTPMAIGTATEAGGFLPRTSSMTAQFVTGQGPASRSVVIPLSQAEMAGGSGGNGGAPGGAAAGGLNARAFPLQRTLLAAVLAQAAELAPPRRTPTATTATPPSTQKSMHSVMGRALAGAAGAPSPVPAGALGSIYSSGGSPALAVVEDTQIFVQNVHKPSADIVMLMGLRRPTTSNGATTTPSTHSAVAPVVSGPNAEAAPALANAVVSGNGQPMGLTPPPSVPQSLLVLTAALDGGAALGLYVCFARRLPLPLLEAVRASAQQLVDQMLAPIVRAKLRDTAIAPEFGTLCTASPGFYAVVRTPSCSGVPGTPGQQPLSQLALALPSLSAALMSTGGGGDLAAALGMNGTATLEPITTTAEAAAGDLLSEAGDELSTADVELLLAEQAAASGGAPMVPVVEGAVAAARESLQHQAISAGGKRNISHRMSLERVIAARRSAGAGTSFTRLAPTSVNASANGMTSPYRGSQQQAAGAHPLTPRLALSGLSLHHSFGLPGPNAPESARAAARLLAAASANGSVGGTPGHSSAAAVMAHVHQHPATAPGMSTLGGAGSGKGGAAAGTGGGGGTLGPDGTVEALNISLLLGSNPGDMFQGLGGPGAPPVPPGLGSRHASLRSLPNLLVPGLEACSASILTVESVAPAGTARQQLDLLVTSIQATITTDMGLVATQGAAHADDLDTLEVGDVLGKGGGGIVFRGRLGTLDVAVKLMELSKVDPVALAASQQQQQQQQAAKQTAAVGAEADAAVAAAEKASLNARREMLRNAMELAVQSRISHPNIVQIYSTYNNVMLVSRRGAFGVPGSTFQLAPVPEPGSPDEALVTAALAAAQQATATSQPKNWVHVPSVAAVFELCDGGCLGSLLASRTFPRPARGGSLRQGFAVDMKGVYMVLLDVALALRHLHSMNLVHRDLKPANLLLKANPRDYRGFTVKLADFGFVLHMSEVAEDGTRYVMADQACGTVTHMACEAMLGKAKIDASVDVFSFGILMWEMFSGGVRPYPHIQPDKIPRLVYKGARPTFNDDVPLQYRSLAAACWSHLPDRRPKAHELVTVLNNMLQQLEQ